MSKVVVPAATAGAAESANQRTLMADAAPVHWQGLRPAARNLLWRGRGGPAWSWVALLILVAAVWPAALLAHGGGTPQLTGVVAGPYRLFAWTTPEPWRVGEVHTTVAVTQPDANGRDVPISGAQVTVTYQPAVATLQPIQVTAVEGSGAQAGFYEADATLPGAGAWTVIIEVAGSAGSGEATFVYSVLPAASGVNWWLVGLGIAGIALVAGMLLALQHTKRHAALARSQKPAGGL